MTTEQMTPKRVKTRREIQAKTGYAVLLRTKTVFDEELRALTTKHGPCPPGLLRELYILAISATVFAWPDRPSGIFPPHPSFTNITTAYEEWVGGKPA